MGGIIFGIASEHQEQAALFEWWGHYSPEELRELLFAIPNGGARNVWTGAMLKREGVRKGVPDIFLAYPKNGKHGLFIEMKRVKGGRIGKEQEHMISALQNAGYACAVCRGWASAKEAICRYLD